MTRKDLVEKYEHEILGIVLDAYVSTARGIESSVALRHWTVQVRERLGKIFEQDIAPLLQRLETLEVKK